MSITLARGITVHWGRAVHQKMRCDERYVVMNTMPKLTRLAIECLRLEYIPEPEVQRLLCEVALRWFRESS